MNRGTHDQPREWPAEGSSKPMGATGAESLKCCRESPERQRADHIRRCFLHHYLPSVSKGGSLNEDDCPDDLTPIPPLRLT